MTIYLLWKGGRDGEGSVTTISHNCHRVHDTVVTVKHMLILEVCRIIHRHTSIPPLSNLQSGPGSRISEFIQLWSSAGPRDKMCGGTGVDKAVLDELAAEGWVDGFVVMLVACGQDGGGGWWVVVVVVVGGGSW